jgi:methyltransferase (TIGR00027 family)
VQYRTIRLIGAYSVKSDSPEERVVTRSATEQPVQTTGWLTAAVRARECRRDDAYLADPCAWPLVTDEVVAQIEQVAGIGLSMDFVVVRGRLGDEVIRRAAARGVRQAVGLGAGSDTRPYRLDLPAGFGFFELDLPGQVATKHDRLAGAGFAPVHQAVSVEGDLRGDFSPGLLAAGFAPDQPCVWYAEGLLLFLEPAQVSALIDRVSALSAGGSEFVFDAMHEDCLTGVTRQRVVECMRQLDLEPSYAPAEGPVRHLAGHGWTVATYQDADLLAGGCPLVPPLPARLCADPPLARYGHATRPALS